MTRIIENKESYAIVSSVMSPCSQTFSVDFLNFYWKEEVEELEEISKQRKICKK